MGLRRNVSLLPLHNGMHLKHSPNHPLKLLLADVGRHLACDLTGTQGGGQGVCHVVLDRSRDRVTLVGGTNQDFGRAFMFEVAGANLRDGEVRDE